MRLEGFRVALILMVVACIASAQSQIPSAAQDEDAEQLKIYEEGVKLLKLRIPQEAISNFDRVIAHYESMNPDKNVQVYCTKSTLETLAVLGKHMKENPKTSAIATRASWWCDAYYHRAYALIELGRLEEAKSSLVNAISHSPMNSQYLSELAFVYHREKDWNKSLETYQAAEKAAETTPGRVDREELSKARRGIGYALIELNRLDEAEAKYMQCLETDPNDSRSRSQLEYIRHLRASKASQ